MITRVVEAISLTAGLYAGIIEHARAGLPNEVVGILGGHDDGRIAVGVPLRNLMGSRAFLADPFAQFQAERSLARSNLQLIAIYHSHPGGAAQLSPSDVAFAQAHPCVHLVVALDRPERLGEEMRAFRVRGDRVLEVEVRLLG